ncbi:MAG: flavodoxin [Treponema sp.]|jgi:flavodoxin|nr:flavodoxin [Treponema sp.]
MKTLVIYYSYDGNCALVAERLAAALKADTLRLETADGKRRSGLAKYVWGGRMVFSRAMPALKPYTVNPEDYDRIVIGFPVWAGSPAPPLLAFLPAAKISGKRVALFCCHGGGKGRALQKAGALLEGNTLIGEADFVNPARGNPEQIAARIDGWAKRLEETP